MTRQELKSFIRQLSHEKCTVRRVKFPNSCAHYRLYEFADGSQLLIGSSLAIALFIGGQIVTLRAA
jgi:hypothetical protein